MQGEDRTRRLRWLCRRGMKELDVLLESFLEKNHDDLKNGAWGQFEGLLDQEDDMIWSWLQKLKTPDSEEFLVLIDEIRRGA
jgi:antitoxin CptB